MYQWRDIEKETGEVLTGSSFKIIDMKGGDVIMIIELD